MSSHHIVREAQEPALIIANGEACSWALLGNLLEWSPFVIVLDAALTRVLPLGIKVDVLLGDFDTPPDRSTLPPDLMVVHTPDQNKTDLEKAFDYLIERNHTAVNVVWATGRRADHTLANIAIMAAYRDRLRVVMFDDHSKVFLLGRSYEKWYPANTPISLMPLGTATGITTIGLAYPLVNEALTLGYRHGNSNHVLIDGFVKITHQTGDLLLMECWDTPIVSE